MRKKEALRILEVSEEAGFDQAKRAFRRQAMKWHPDRNSAPEAEGRFKTARAAFEALESRHLASSWNDPDPDLEDSVESPDAAPEPPYEGPERRSRARPRAKAGKPPPRKAWDPPQGPAFRVGDGARDRHGSAAEFWTSFFDVAESALSGGARPKIAAALLARGFHGYMGEMAFEMGDLPGLRLGFLRGFWSRRHPGLFEACELAMERAKDLGWADRVALTLDFKAPLFVCEQGRFLLLEVLAKALPSGEPMPSEMAFYRKAAESLPEVFANLESSEKALRLAARTRGWRPGEMLIEAALDRCPRLLELWAPLGTPQGWGARSDWLGRALAAGVDMGALAGWVHAEPLHELCARVSELTDRRARELASLAELRIEAAGEWRLAGAWAGARTRSLGRAQRRWEALKKSLKAGAGGDVALALRLASISPAAGCWRMAVLGTLEQARRALAKAAHEGRLQEVAVMGAMGPLPLAAACAMRGFFEPGAELDFSERARAIEEALGIGQLGRADPEGRSALDWFEMSISRREGRSF